MIACQVGDVFLDVLRKSFSERLSNKPIVRGALVHHKVVLILLRLKLEAIKLSRDISGNLLEVL